MSKRTVALETKQNGGTKLPSQIVCDGHICEPGVASLPRQLDLPIGLKTSSHSARCWLW